MITKNLHLNALRPTPRFTDMKMPRVTLLPIKTLYATNFFDVKTLDAAKIGEKIEP